MFKFISLIIISISSILFAADFVVQQNDWMGGDGVPGPVANWGTQFYTGDSISTASFGSVSLVANDWDFSDWVRHEIDTDSHIGSHHWGFQPADIDGDGDLDLVGFTDRIMWYEKTGHFIYVPHEVDGSELFTAGSPNFTQPVDIDGDGDIDIVRSNGSVLDYFVNDGAGASWSRNILTDSYMNVYCLVGDVDYDGDMDIVNFTTAIFTGSMAIWWNDGGTFTREPISSISSIWRAHLADMDNDGFIDIVVTGNLTPHSVIFRNDGAGNFTEVFNSGGSVLTSIDGSYPEDIDMDGDLDIVFGGNHSLFSTGFGAYLNDGTGISYSRMVLVDDAGSYADGAMASDIDLDGHADIAGGFNAVGWFRQSPTTSLEFTEHNLYESTPGDTLDCHWILVANLDEQSCIPSMDILISAAGQFTIFENRMLLSFASDGFLESSILEVSDALHTANFSEIGWEACIPSDSSIAFFYRAGDDPVEITSLPWQGPHWGSTLDTPDSIGISATGRYFQYRAGFFMDELITDIDIAVLHRFWVEYDTVSSLVPPTVDSIWFVEETDCDGINMVEICYTMASPDSVSGDVVVEFSSAPGPTWDIVPATITNDWGDLGVGVIPGEHCFNWELSADMPNIEGYGWLARAIVVYDVFADTVTTAGPLDSRPPTVAIDCANNVIVDEAIVISWSAQDSFWVNDPGTLYIEYLDFVDTAITGDTSYIWYPDWGTINNEWVDFRVVMRDSFCNWGMDTCSMRLCEDISAPSITAIETLTDCYDTAFTMRFVLDDSGGSGLDYSSVSVVFNDTFQLDYELSGDTVIIHGGEDIYPNDSAIVCISTCDDNLPCTPNCTEQCWYVWRCPNIYGCGRIPNPFTPNDDGINDFCQFSFPEMELRDASIFIYDIHNSNIRTIDVPDGFGAKLDAQWNGKDDDGNSLPQGLYIWIIEANGEIICEGTVTIAR